MASNQLMITARVVFGAHIRRIKTIKFAILEGLSISNVSTSGDVLKHFTVEDHSID